MTDTTNDAIVDYFSERQVARQWRPFLAALAAELFENLPPDQATGFLRQVGRRMADGVPLAEAGTLERLEAAVNAVLADLDWGVVTFTAGDGEVAILHRAFPYRIDGDARHWPRAFAAFAEGLFTGWMHGQGAGPSLTTRVTGRPDIGTLALSFGRG